MDIKKKKKLNSYYLTLVFSQKVAYSCSVEGTVMVWDISTLQVRFKTTLWDSDCVLLVFCFENNLEFIIWRF